jgi:hypothetical protein
MDNGDDNSSTFDNGSTTVDDDASSTTRQRRLAERHAARQAARQAAAVAAAAAAAAVPVLPQQLVSHIKQQGGAVGCVEVTAWCLYLKLQLQEFSSILIQCAIDAAATATATMLAVDCVTWCNAVTYSSTYA